MCIGAGLVGGEAFSIDASLIKADVNKTKRIPGDQPFSWPKAVTCEFTHNREPKHPSAISHEANAREAEDHHCPR